MDETLTCPSCQHTLTSGRTPGLKDTKVVRCNKCDTQSTLGEWRAIELGEHEQSDPLIESPNAGPISGKNTNELTTPSLPESNSPSPVLGDNIGVAAETSSSFHKKLECPSNHKFEVKTSEEGKQVPCPECGALVLVPKTPLIVMIIAVPIFLTIIIGTPMLVCSGCLSIFSGSGSDRPEFNSVESDMDKFDSHFPNASAEERRLTKELYEQDSRRRGY